MTHPITPSPELVRKWLSEYFGHPVNGEEISSYELDLATQAARWGADQELEACCEWLDFTDCDNPQEMVKELRADRRPKPPNLKEQGMASLNEVIECLKALVPGAAADGPAIETIRRALNELPDE